MLTSAQFELYQQTYKEYLAVKDTDQYTEDELEDKYLVKLDHWFYSASKEQNKVVASLGI